MSVPNQTPYIVYNANGLTTVFPFEFYIINTGDIQVSINGAVVTSGYTVSGVGNIGGGDVIFLTPPANGSVVMLERVVPTYRLTDYQDNGDLLADTLNKDFDRLWMAIQRSFIYLGLALRRPILGGPFDAEGYRISKLADPINDGDAVNKGWVDRTYKDVLQQAKDAADRAEDAADRAEDAVEHGITNLLNVASVKALLTTVQLTAVSFNVLGYVPGTDFGGGIFYWNPDKPKSQHNGITIFSPTVPWDGSYAGLAAFLAGTGETDGSGSGCWIRVNSPLDAIHTEWAGHDVTGANDSTASVNACINKFGGVRPIRISPGTLKISFPTTYQYHDAFDVARHTSILITNKNSVHIYAENDVNINTDGNGEIERVCFGVINCTNFYFSGFKFNQTCTNFSTGPSDTTFTPQENWFGFEIEGSSGEIDDIDVLASRIFVMADVAGTGGTPNKDITVSRVRTELVTNYTFLTRNLDGVAKMLDCYMYRTGRTWHTFGEDFAASWDTKYMIAERNHFVNPISIQSRVGPWGVTNGAVIKSNVKSGGGIFVEIGGPANGTAAQNVVIDGNVSDTVVNYDGTYSSHVLIIWNGSNDYQKSFNGIKITNNAFSGGSFAINDYAEMQMTNKCYGLVIESNQFNRTDSVKVTMPTWYKSIFKNNKVFITAGNTGCEIGGYSPTIDCNYFDSTYIISTSGLRIDEMLITNNLFSNSLSSPINQLIDMPKFTGMTYTNNRTTFTIRKFRNNADMIECGWHLADITAGFSAAPSSVYAGKVNIGIGDIIHNAGIPSSGTNWAWYGLGNGTYGNLNIA